MDEKTAQLLEKLAQKLGTTTEYLWRVLIKQAPVSATVDLVQVILILLFGFFMYKTHCRFMKKDPNSKHGESKYEQLNEFVAIPMILGGVAFIIFTIYAFCCIGNIINGYFNPEYWALNRIMGTIS